MQPFQTLWARRRFDPRNLDPRALRIMRLLVILSIVTVVMIAMSIAFFSITLVLQALDGILLTLQAILWTIERGDIFLKAVLCALILLVVITFVTKRYGPFLRRLFYRHH